MTTAKLSLVLAEGYAAVALWRNGKVINHSAIHSTGNVAHDVDVLFAENEKKIREHGKRIASVTIVSDAARKAILSGTDLSKVALIRLSAPEGRDSPPLLKTATADKVLSSFTVVKGGHGFDGRVIGTPDATEIESCYDEVKRAVDTFVVTSPFSILYPAHEQYALARLSKLGAKRVWASTQVSTETCMLDRETTSILTASTSRVLEKIEAEVLLALRKLGCKPSVYFGRNDGTVFGNALARRFPLDTAWSVEGNSAAGAAKAERVPKCLVVGMNDKETWLVGTEKGRPLMRRVSYLDDMLIHVQSPIIADFSLSTPNETKKFRHQLISQFSGSKRTFSADLTESYGAPFTISKRANSAAYAAINAVTSTIEWTWTYHVPGGTDLKVASRELKRMVQAHMKLGGAISYKLGSVTSRPGVNLPESTTTLSVQARGFSI